MKYGYGDNIIVQFVTSYQAKCLRRDGLRLQKGLEKFEKNWSTDKKKNLNDLNLVI